MRVVGEDIPGYAKHQRINGHAAIDQGYALNMQDAAIVNISDIHQRQQVEVLHRTVFIDDHDRIAGRRRIVRAGYGDVQRSRSGSTVAIGDRIRK